MIDIHFPTPETLFKLFLFNSTALFTFKLSDTVQSFRLYESCEHNVNIRRLLCHLRNKMKYGRKLINSSSFAQRVKVRSESYSPTKSENFQYRVAKNWERAGNESWSNFYLRKRIVMTNYLPEETNRDVEVTNYPPELWRIVMLKWRIIYLSCDESWCWCGELSSWGKESWCWIDLLSSHLFGMRGIRVL